MTVRQDSSSTVVLNAVSACGDDCFQAKPWLKRGTPEFKELQKAKRQAREQRQPAWQSPCASQPILDGVLVTLRPDRIRENY